MSAVLTQPETSTATSEGVAQHKYEVSVSEEPGGTLPYRFWFRDLGASEWRPIDEMHIVAEGGISLAVFYLVEYEEGMELPNFTTHPIQWVVRTENPDKDEYQPIGTPGTFEVVRNDNQTCTITITNTTRSLDTNEFFICATYRHWLAGAHPTVTCLPDG